MTSPRPSWVWVYLISLELGIFSKKNMHYALKQQKDMHYSPHSISAQQTISCCCLHREHKPAIHFGEWGLGGKGERGKHLGAELAMDDQK